MKIQSVLRVCASERPPHGRASRRSFLANATTGALELDPSGDPVDAFEHFANHEPCPALDPEHGTCDLYAWRPQTCRVFGPPIAAGEGYGVCELCFQTATPQEVAQAAITPPCDHASLRRALPYPR
jgi:Fe-S-cluster containining protein